MRIPYFLLLTGQESTNPRKTRSDSYSDYIENFAVDSYTYYESDDVPLALIPEAGDGTTTFDGPKGLSETTTSSEKNTYDCSTSLCHNNQTDEKPIIKIIRKIEDQNETDVPTTFEKFYNEVEQESSFGTLVPENPIHANVEKIILIIIGTILLVLLFLFSYYCVRNWTTRCLPIRARFGLVSRPNFNIINREISILLRIFDH